MALAATFSERVNAHIDRISPAERRVARFFQLNREEVLIASAAELADKIGTSDATVIRATKALGFAGMDELRRTLAEELKDDLSPANRVMQTLNAIGDDLETAFRLSMDMHQAALQSLQRDVTPALFRHAVELIIDAKRVHVFGIGPSGALADYLAIQLGRYGIESSSMTQTGLLLADGIQRMRQGDLLVMFSYGRVYRELSVLLTQAQQRGIAKLLFSDGLGLQLADRVDLYLPVERGRADLFGTHTATLALIEALLIGIPSRRADATLANLRALNRMRGELLGEPMDFPM
jgi:DNA-binding MurR/RpiR family transcriptional regulator